MGLNSRYEIRVKTIARRINRVRGAAVQPRRRSLSPRASAAACCALGLLPGGLPGRLVRVGAGSLSVIGAGRFGRVLGPGRVLPGLGFGLGRPGLRARPRIIPLLPRRGHLLLCGPLGPGSPCLRAPRLLLGGGLRLPSLRQLRLGLPRGHARLPPVSLGLLGTGLKPGPGLLGRRDLRFEPGPQPGLIPLGVPAGLRHLLLRSPAAPVQLRPSRLGRQPRLSQPRLSPACPACPACPAWAARASAARASCSAAAFASCASPSRSSAPAAAARASRTSASARSARA